LSDFLSRDLRSFSLISFVGLGVRLVKVVGGSARPLGTTAQPPSTTARRRGRGSGTGWWSWRLPGPGATARTTACRWGRWVVVTWQLVIGPFE
jgi:hypothetical protein